MNTQKITQSALFASVSLIIFVLESFIPPIVPIPGFKLGLANVVTLSAIYILGRKEAFFILMVRIVLGNLFTGQLMSMFYSLCGGLMCFGITALLKSFFQQNTIWTLGIIGAVFHNIGQTLCAYFLFSSVSLIYYGVILCITAFATGTFTGLCAQYCVKYFSKNIY